MELQWPLIIFTTLLAWSAGTFATQCLLALKGEGTKAQMPSLVVSTILMVVGGIAVFFHLEHWERIFNGFGHITSGITQELIAIVLLAVVMVVYFAFLRKGEGKVPAWISILGAIMSVVLVVVMAHSYMMIARPAWDSVAWVLCVLGNSCVFGPLTVAVIGELVEGEAESPKEGQKGVGLFAVVGSIVNAALSLAYVFVMNTAALGASSVEYFFDPTEPNMDIASSYSVFGPDSIVVTLVGIVLVGAILPIVGAFLGKKQAKWTAWGSCALVCAVIGAVCMRVVFYQMGFSTFALF